MGIGAKNAAKDAANEENTLSPAVGAMEKVAKNLVERVRCCKSADAGSVG
jgi:hypothetical protein